MGGLMGGLDREELHVLYQPEVSCIGERLIGVESLVRWESAPEGAGSLDQMVRAVERSGDIDRFGEWVLRRACRQAAVWPGIFVAVNVSPLQFRSDGFVDMVFDAAGACSLDLHRLELEITENSFFEDVETAERQMRRLRDAGVRIALDDFGVGYSSLTYLRRLPLDRLKIDKSFVEDLSSPGTAEIVKAVIALGKALGLKVTAEGVERRSQFDFLRSAGCDCVQGFLFSGPLEADRIAEWLDREAKEAAAG